MSNAKLWNGYMRSYDFLTQVDGYAQNMRDIANAVGVRPGTRVLDAGSGTGNLSLLLKERGAQVVSCDFSTSALEAHRAKDPQAHLVQASLEERLPFPDRHFDAICCASVLFALSKSGCRLAASEFRRTLKPGGRLVATVPAQEARLINLVRMHRRSAIQRHGPLLGRVKAVWDSPALARVLYYNHKLFGLPDWQGFHRFQAPELDQLFQEAGLDGIACTRTYGSVFLLVTARRPAEKGAAEVRKLVPLAEAPGALH